MSLYKRCPLCGEWYEPGGGKCKGRPRLECPACHKKILDKINVQFTLAKRERLKGKTPRRVPLNGEIRAAMLAERRAALAPKPWRREYTIVRGTIPPGYLGTAMRAANK